MDKIPPASHRGLSVVVQEYFEILKNSIYYIIIEIIEFLIYWNILRTDGTVREILMTICWVPTGIPSTSNIW